MPKSQEYNWKEYGIELPLILIGSIEILHIETNSPIVFLIDETHDNLNSINDNVQNAIELIKKAKVDIVGVESHRGGKQWGDYDEVYRPTVEIRNVKQFKKSVNTCPNFAIQIPGIYQDFVFGVEHEGMFNKIHCNLSVDDNPYFGKPVVNHPLNIERSKHFIRTLFEIRERVNGKGNLILNCGSNHNTHIKELIKKSEIEDITLYKASYIRLNTI